MLAGVCAVCDLSRDQEQEPDAATQSLLQTPPPPRPPHHITVTHKKEILVSKREKYFDVSNGTSIGGIQSLG